MSSRYCFSVNVPISPFYFSFSHEFKTDPSLLWVASLFFNQRLDRRIPFEGRLAELPALPLDDLLTYFCLYLCVPFFLLVEITNQSSAHSGMYDAIELSNQLIKQILDALDFLPIDFMLHNPFLELIFIDDHNIGRILSRKQ